MSYDLPITGGCHCGAIRWEADDEPNQLYACHCRICQRHTGSAFWVGAKFPEGSFRFVQGTPAVYRSSEILERFYCADCGSSIALKYIERPWKDREPGFEAAFGSFDDPTPLSPELHFGAESKHAWLHFDPSIPQYRADDDVELQAAFKAAENGEQNS